MTNVPAQALAMLNDPFVVGQADVWSKQLLLSKNDGIERRLDAMFQSALGRSPTVEEQGRFVRFVHQVAQLHNVPAEAILSSAAVWRDVGHTIFNLQEFITIP